MRKVIEVAGAQRKCAVQALWCICRSPDWGGREGRDHGGRQSGVGMMLLIRTKAASPSQGGKIQRFPAPTFTSQKASPEQKVREAEVKQSSPRRIGRQKLFSEESPEAWVSPTCQILTENPRQLTCPSFLFLLLKCGGKLCLSHLSRLWRPVGRMPMISLRELKMPNMRDSHCPSWVGVLVWSPAIWLLNTKRRQSHLFQRVILFHRKVHNACKVLGTVSDKQ